MIIDLEQLKTQQHRYFQETWTTYFPQCNNFVMTYDKCDIKATLCDDRDDTCVIMFITLGMSVIDVYMVASIHLHNRIPLKPPKQALIHCVILNIWKYYILLFLQKGPKYLEKTHTMDFECLRWQYERPR